MTSCPNENKLSPEPVSAASSYDASCNSSFYDFDSAGSSISPEIECARGSANDSDGDEDDVEIALKILAQMEAQEKQRNELSDEDEEETPRKLAGEPCSGTSPISMIITSIEQAAQEARRLEIVVSSSASEASDNEDSDTDESLSYLELVEDSDLELSEVEESSHEKKVGGKRKSCNSDDAKDGDMDNEVTEDKMNTETEKGEDTPSKNEENRIGTCSGLQTDQVTDFESNNTKDPVDFSSAKPCEDYVQDQSLSPQNVCENLTLQQGQYDAGNEPQQMGPESCLSTLMPKSDSQEENMNEEKKQGSATESTSSLEGELQEKTNSIEEYHEKIEEIPFQDSREENSNAPTTTIQGTDDASENREETQENHDEKYDPSQRDGDNGVTIAQNVSEFEDATCSGPGSSSDMDTSEPDMKEKNAQNAGENRQNSFEVVANDSTKDQSNESESQPLSKEVGDDVKPVGESVVVANSSEVTEVTSNVQANEEDQAVPKNEISTPISQEKPDDPTCVARNVLCDVEGKTEVPTPWLGEIEEDSKTHEVTEMPTIALEANQPDVIHGDDTTPSESVSAQVVVTAHVEDATAAEESVRNVQEEDVMTDEQVNNEDEIVSSTEAGTRTEEASLECQRLEYEEACPSRNNETELNPSDSSPEVRDENEQSEELEPLESLSEDPQEGEVRKKVHFRDPFIEPPAHEPPRSGEEIIEANTQPQKPLCVHWKKPSAQLTEVINAAMGPSLSRRSHACGTLKVLANNTKNKYTLARTRGILEALGFVAKQTPVPGSVPSKEARHRAVTTIFHLCSTSENRRIVTEHPIVIESLIKTIREDRGESRALCCSSLAMLAKASDNRLLMTKFPFLLTALAETVGGVGIGTSVENEEDSFQSYERYKTRRTGVDDFDKSAQSASCATLMLLAKDCASLRILCRHEVLLKMLAEVSTDFGLALHTNCIEILCNFTRFPENNGHLASKNFVVEALIECTKSELQEDRVWAARALQNITSDKESKSFLATGHLLTALSLCALSEENDEQTAALGGLLNLSADLGTVSALTGTKNVVSTLINLAHFSNASTEVRMMACDCLAAIGLWLQTLAGTGVLPDGMEKGVLPTLTATGWQRWD